MTKFTYAVKIISGLNESGLYRRGFVMIRKLLMAFIIIIISLYAAGCDSGNDNPGTGDTKARWGTAEFGTDKWNP